MTGARVICKVDVMDSPVAARAGYHDIGAFARRVILMAATSDARAGYHS